MEQLLINISTGIVIAVASSWITVILSLRKFRRQKIWEKKLEAYSKIIKSLHHIKEANCDDENFLLGINETQKYSIKKYKFSLEELLKYKNMGSLIIAEKAVQVLINFHKELEKSQINNIHKDCAPIEHVELVAQLTEDCLKSVIFIAKDDLSL